MAGRHSPLERARRRLHSLPLPTLPDGSRVDSWSLVGSPAKGKRFRLIAHLSTAPDQHGFTKLKTRTVDFGAKAPDTYLDHGDEVRRRNFHTRFAAMIKRTELNPLSPMWLSANILW